MNSAGFPDPEAGRYSSRGFTRPVIGDIAGPGEGAHRSEMYGLAASREDHLVGKLPLECVCQPVSEVCPTPNGGAIAASNKINYDSLVFIRMRGLINVLY